MIVRVICSENKKRRKKNDKNIKRDYKLTKKQDKINKRFDKKERRLIKKNNRKNKKVFFLGKIRHNTTRQLFSLWLESVLLYLYIKE